MRPSVPPGCLGLRCPGVALLQAAPPRPDGGKRQTCDLSYWALSGWKSSTQLNIDPASPRIKAVLHKTLTRQPNLVQVEARAPSAAPSRDISAAPTCHPHHRCSSRARAWDALAGSEPKPHAVCPQPPRPHQRCPAGERRPGAPLPGVSCVTDNGSAGFGRCQIHRDTHPCHPKVGARPEPRSPPARPRRPRSSSRGAPGAAARGHCAGAVTPARG